MVETILRLTRPVPLVRALVAVIGIVHGLWIMRVGARVAPDTITYSIWADRLISYEFNYGAFLRNQDFATPSVLYVLWVSLVAAAKLLAGPAWPSLIVLLNWLAVLAFSFVLLRDVLRLTESTPAVLVAAGMMMVSVDILVFEAYAMSDTLFLGMCVGVFVIAIRAIELGRSVWEPGGRRVVVLGTVLVIAACLFRPAGPPLLALWLGVLLWPVLGDTARRYTPSALLVVVAVGIVIHSAVMQDPSRWPFASTLDWMRQLSTDYLAGAVVYHRPHTYADPTTTLLDFSLVTLRKWAYYFAVWLPGYSLVHTLANLVFFVPAYLLSGVALARSLSGGLDLRSRRAVAVLVGAIGCFSLFHALNQIDYDHRYRLPVLAALVMLAGIGVSSLAARSEPRAHTGRFALGARRDGHLPGLEPDHLTFVSLF